MHKGGHTTGPNLDTFVTWAARYIKNASPAAPSSPPPSGAANESATPPAAPGEPGGYDPTIGAEPIQTLHGVDSLKLTLSDHALIIAIGQR